MASICIICLVDLMPTIVSLMSTCKWHSLIYLFLNYYRTSIFSLVVWMNGVIYFITFYLNVWLVSVFQILGIYLICLVLRKSSKSCFLDRIPFTLHVAIFRLFKYITIICFWVSHQYFWLLIWQVSLTCSRELYCA